MRTLLKPLLSLMAVFGLALPLLTTQALGQGAGYKIQPGDVLQLEVLEDATLNRSLLVLPDGSVSVPQAGQVQAAGQTVAAVQAAVTAALAPNFATPPTVYLAVGQIAPPVAATGSTVSGIFVLGEVAKPGRVDVPPGTTMLQFLAEAGGFTPFAATKRIQLRRTDAAGVEQVWTYDLSAIMAGKPAPAIVLKKGDVIVVPQRRLFE